MHVIHSSEVALRGFKMVRAGVSTMKFKEANHDEPPQCTSLIGSSLIGACHMHLDHFTEKKNEKYKNYKRKSR